MYGMMGHDARSFPMGIQASEGAFTGDVGQVGSGPIDVDMMDVDRGTTSYAYGDGLIPAQNFEYSTFGPVCQAGDYGEMMNRMSGDIRLPTQQVGWTQQGAQGRDSLAMAVDATFMDFPTTTVNQIVTNGLVGRTGFPILSNSAPTEAPFLPHPSFTSTSFSTMGYHEVPPSSGQTGTTGFNTATLSHDDLDSNTFVKQEPSDRSDDSMQLDEDYIESNYDTDCEMDCPEERPLRDSSGMKYTRFKRGSEAPENRSCGIPLHNCHNSQHSDVHGPPISHDFANPNDVKLQETKVPVTGTNRSSLYWDGTMPHEDPLVRPTKQEVAPITKPVRSIQSTQSRGTRTSSSSPKSVEVGSPRAPAKDKRGTRLYEKPQPRGLFTFKFINRGSPNGPGNSEAASIGDGYYMMVSMEFNIDDIRPKKLLVLCRCGKYLTLHTWEYLHRNRELEGEQRGICPGDAILSSSLPKPIGEWNGHHQGQTYDQCKTCTVFILSKLLFDHEAKCGIGKLYQSLPLLLAESPNVGLVAVGSTKAK
ncbi:hypothetical protein BJ508DRAFT_380215 [Ascobolus immersus RN42]|uniref:Uncharacterized protein n=1 Tax=Ascobolus immersus RN42 TaxID=1160509 RepID=A0A3N4HT61_ASCIM|nr:hypothetical protein BJ508DRAFT_380215 [Ascobolus immersus RN42]